MEWVLHQNPLSPPSDTPEGPGVTFDGARPAVESDVFFDFTDLPLPSTSVVAISEEDDDDGSVRSCAYEGDTNWTVDEMDEEQEIESPVLRRSKRKHTKPKMYGGNAQWTE